MVNKHYKELINRAKCGGKHHIRALGLINALRDYDLDDYQRIERIDDIMRAYNDVCRVPNRTVVNVEMVDVSHE